MGNIVHLQGVGAHDVVSAKEVQQFVEENLQRLTKDGRTSCAAW